MAKVSKTVVKISNKYEPKLTEKYMCEKHKSYFKKKLSNGKLKL